MATKKKPASGPEKRKPGANHAEYEAALAAFSGAVDLLHSGQLEQALEAFERLAATNIDEPVLLDRARSYARVCRRRMGPAPPEPDTPDELFYHAVVLANGGRHDDALEVLDRILKQQPDSARALYVRASVWAKKGNAEAAVADLRQTIALEPQVRFQAVNDADFERIREEPSFIDVIEPTPAEA